MANKNVTLKNKDGDSIYPLTYTDNVYDSENIDLDTILSNIRSSISTAVQDANYVHTDNNFTNTYKSNIETNNLKVSNVQSDWNSTSGLSEILNKPTLATVATSGNYSDLTGQPTIPTLYSTTGQNTDGAMTQKASTDELNNKMDSTNPSGTGSLSLNRLPDSTIGSNSATLGIDCSASNTGSFAVGNTTKASGKSACAFGEGTQAIRKSQNVFGEYNIADPTGGINSRGTYVEIVGNGTGASLANKSNARTLDWSGNEWLAGNLQAAGLTDGTTTKTMTEVLAGESCEWGDISGTLSNQSDLQSALDSKLNTSDATTTATANKLVMRDANGHIYGNYIEGTWGQFTASAENEQANYSGIAVYNNGWLYKRSLQNLKTDLNIPHLPIGMIFHSALPQEDGMYGLLDGHSISISTYNDFYTLLNSLKTEYSYLVCTIAQYASDMTTYGQCGRFVINDTSSAQSSGNYSVDANSIKLPTITRFIEGLTSLDDLGKAIAAGLPNITGELIDGMNYGNYFVPNQSSGALDYTLSSQTNLNGGSGSQNFLKSITFNASNSNSIYGNSTTVQPQAVKCAYYIVLATTATVSASINLDANWSITASSGALYFMFNNTPKMKLSNDGQIDITNINLVDNITPPV